MRRLREAGIETVLLTGDNERTAAAVAAQVGVDRVLAGVLPAGKAAEVQRLQAAGRRVAMVGDGVNDAPALAAADVGIAMGTGADVAMEAAGVTLMRADPLQVGDAIAVSRATYHKIRQGLFWAFIYNVVGLPLAALGLLSPLMAGAAMALSSVSIVTNADQDEAPLHHNRLGVVPILVPTDVERRSQRECKPDEEKVVNRLDEHGDASCGKPGGAGRPPRHTP